MLSGCEIESTNHCTNRQGIVVVQHALKNRLQYLQQTQSVVSGSVDQSEKNCREKRTAWVSVPPSGFTLRLKISVSALAIGTSPM